MRKWGRNSLHVYNQLDPRLQGVVDRVLLEVADVSLLTGHRPEDEQNAQFDAGTSALRWPDSRHNSMPAKAVDLQPYPRPASKEKLWASLAYIAGHAIRIAASDGVILRWGGDWNRNGDLTDQTFDDLFHLEIVDTHGSYYRADCVHSGGSN